MNSKTNPELLKTVNELRGQKEHRPFFRKVASYLEKPTRSMISTNVSKLETLCSAKEDVVVPGKVLAAGEISKPVNVYAFNFSGQAKQKIEKAGGKCMGMKELVKSGKCPKIIC